MGHDESQIGYLANYISLCGRICLPACIDTTVVER